MECGRRQPHGRGRGHRRRVRSPLDAVRDPDPELRVRRRPPHPRRTCAPRRGRGLGWVLRLGPSARRCDMDAGDRGPLDRPRGDRPGHLADPPWPDGRRPSPSASRQARPGDGISRPPQRRAAGPGRRPGLALGGRLRLVRRRDGSRPAGRHGRREPRDPRGPLAWRAVRLRGPTTTASGPPRSCRDPSRSPGSPCGWRRSARDPTRRCGARRGGTASRPRSRTATCRSRASPATWPASASCAPWPERPPMLRTRWWPPARRRATTEPRRQRPSPPSRRPAPPGGRRSSRTGSEASTPSGPGSTPGPPGR